MSDWKHWCRICANFEASSAVDENVKQTALSVFEITNAFDNFCMCTRCFDFVNELMNMCSKAQKVNELFEDLNNRECDLNFEDLVLLREAHQLANPTAMDFDNFDTIESNEEIITEEIEYLEETEDIESNELTDDSNVVQFYSYNCHECLMSFENFNILATHCQDSHNCNPKVFCSNCDQFLEKSEAFQHYELHCQSETEIKYECERCNRVYMMESQYDAHLKECSNSEESTRKYSCPICSRSFKENRHVAVHMNTHLPEDKKTYYPCEHCGKNYSNIFSLRQHIKVVHIKKAAFQCPHCNKSFSRKANLESHLNVHSTDKPYECELCGLRLKTKSNLRVHKKIHSTDPNDMVICKICGKKFKTQNQLINHQVSHSEVKRYSCEHCDTSYKRSKELHNHLLSVHFNIKKHCCPWCPKTFVNSSNFRKHKKVMHREELEEYERMSKSDIIDDDDVIIEELDEN